VSAVLAGCAVLGVAVVVVVIVLVADVLGGQNRLNRLCAARFDDRQAWAWAVEEILAGRPVNVR
jgi:hypothetical protein